MVLKLSIITEVLLMSKKTELLEPIFPGEILFEEFMRPLDISIDQLSFDTAISKQTLTDIIQGKDAITAEIALKLGEYFCISPDLWLGLQTDYESRIAKHKVFIPRIIVENQSRGAGFQFA